MPIFQDDFEHASATPIRRDPVAIEPPPASRQRQSSQEKTRTDLSSEERVLDGPIRPTTPRNDEEMMTSDRAELIEMLKRGASPTWIPNRHLESIMQQSQQFNATKSPEPSTDSPALLLPPAQITPEKAKTSDCADQRLQDGQGIERPRSALHSGDFTTDETEPQNRHIPSPCQKREEAHVAPDIWLATSPPRDFLFDFRGSPHLQQGAGSFKSGASPLSSSVSSFVFQPPTSPLVQSETNEELDFSMPLDDMQLLSGRQASSRRHTLHAATSYPSSVTSSPSPSPSPSPGFPNRRRERALPCQAHQPRRSLTGWSNIILQQTEPSPQTPAYLRARRLSIGSDTSPLHHASMVGSYEESILRGRMSTTPSRPIDFLAQIGVLGKGKCKASLRCPPHVTLPFPAVYYCYGTTPHGRSRSDDGPSPYVGQIDLENGLSNPDDESRSRRKTQSRYTERRKTYGEADVAMDDGEAESGRCKTSRPRRRSGSPKAPPGGSYRIPEQGQIQIILKNQNKTAVKLFLVPYDLAGMAPGTKTFIRQRSYSAGPIIDVPNMQADAKDHPILRYLVHLHICCPSKGRYYLYKSIRIVFANRVPDGKEKLRIETTWPDPRFTPYKPIRLMNPPVSTSSGSGAMLVAEKALRRRSLGLPVSASIHPFSRAIQEAPMEPMRSSSAFPMAMVNVATPPLRPDGSNSETPNVATGAPLPRPASPHHRRHAGAQKFFDDGSQYEKLNKGDVGYGGNARGHMANNGASGAGAEGLLSQRLRGLGVKPKPPQSLSPS